MAYQSNDIEKYLRGELTPAEMHALEQKALTDPFLAEALEGAEHAGPENFAVDLEMLHHSIRKKSARKTPRIISINGWQLYVGIAAGLLLLAVSSFVILSMIRDDRKKTEIASAEKAAIQLDSAKDARTLPSENPSDSLIAEIKPEQRESTPTTRPRRKSSPVEKPESSGAVATTPAVETETYGYASDSDQTVTAPTEARADLAEVGVSHDEATSKEKKMAVPSAPQSAGMASGLIPVRMVQGVVLSAEDGVPLPGVNVLIKGTKKGTVTNAEGEYEVPLEGTDDALVFSFIGLTTEEVKVNNAERVDVKMESDVSQLSEMVVTGYGTQRAADDTPVFEMAEPQGGRSAFKKYLEEQMHYPQQALDNNVEGRVTVQFTVQPNGQLSNFQILKGLGYGCDEEVIRLIKEGPAWEPTKQNNTPVQDNVKIRLKFDLPQK